jgi:signal transduction histidine kinase
LDFAQSAAGNMSFWVFRSFLSALLIDCRKWLAAAFWWLSILAVLAITLPATHAAEPKRILLLHSYGRDFSPWHEYARQLRIELRQQIPGPIDIFEASLATARFSDDNSEGLFAGYLRSLFEHRKLDLVITIGAPAANFFHGRHSQIAPATPAVFMGLEQRRVPRTLASSEIAVASVINIAGSLESILHVLPETKNVVVVVGDSPLEQFWVGQLREVFQPFAGRVEFTWFNKLSFEDMLAHSAKLPPQSVIFFVVLSVDAAGVTHEEGKAMDRLYAVANAPMFSWSAIYLGRGIVGGPLTPIYESTLKAAGIAVQILNGRAPSEIASETVHYGKPRFDWREMQRWNISEASLPPGSTTEFRVPTIFEQYKWTIVSVVALLVFQGAIITVLLLNRWRLERERADRQRAETAARDFSERLISVQEDERSRLARELHDDITQRLAALAIEAGRAQGRRGGPADDAAMRDIRDGLVKLSEDVHTLSYRLHPSILDDLGLVEALKAECERFSRLEAIPVDVKIEDGFLNPPPPAALCLFRIAQEALQNTGRHAKATQVDISLQRSDGGFGICVRDNGIGFDPKHRRERASLGLASMQQRIYRLGGELDIDSTPGHGTIVLAWVPTTEKHHESPAPALG